MTRLGNKVAFITGVARGQGRAHAVRLAREGADIIGVDIAGPLPVPYGTATQDDLDETSRLVEAEGRRAHLVKCDVRDYDGLKVAVDSGVDALGGLDYVVANAGICTPETWDEITPESFANTMDINVTGAWNSITVAAPHLISRGGGSVVLTSSLAGVKLQPFMIHYTASKHAMVGLTRGFAAELGIHNIRVNSIHPGAVMSGMTDEAMGARIAATMASNDRLQTMAYPFLNKWSTELDEVSSTVVFLLSDDSASITAEHISLSGGAQYF